MTPEEKARQNIDLLFSDACWSVVDRLHYNPRLSAAAIKEGLLCGNLEADYLLFIREKLSVCWKRREKIRTRRLMLS